ncbi:MAG: MucB/RseB C-terminal domain-containing protein [Pseudomonadales bacterium]|nr:MucB/RseB C-terminal domain-containing protein [Pseudomonadales bacterium]
MSRQFHLNQVLSEIQVQKVDRVVNNIMDRSCCLMLQFSAALSIALLANMPVTAQSLSNTAQSLPNTAQSLSNTAQGLAHSTQNHQPDAEASYWLEKMNYALHQASYQGTFIYMRGKRFDTVKVVHYVNDGTEFERMVNLTGEEREIIRINEQADCYHPADGEFKQVHDVPMGPFTHNFSKSISENQSSYRISLHGKDRIAGRSAIRLSISPRNSDRYGYRLWLDEESGLLLKSDLVNQGRVLELFQFSSVEIGQPIEESQFHSALQDVGRSHSLARTEPQMTASTSKMKPKWRATWVPPGFKQVQTQFANRLSFTDGVATVSIFVDRSGESTMVNMQTSLGATVVLTRQIESSAQQVTVVGEVPLDTAKRVAESIEPVIY